MAGNRVGKTSQAYETTCHLTGHYPTWWEGSVFHGPVKAWAAGKTNETTRDIIQVELLGNITFAASANWWMAPALSRFICSAWSRAS